MWTPLTITSQPPPTVLQTPEQQMTKTAQISSLPRTILNNPSENPSPTPTDMPLQVAPAFKKATTNEEQMKAIREEIHNQGTLPSEHPELKEEIGKHQLMFPRNHALTHDAAPLLHEYATHGCPVDCGPDWSRQQIQALLLRGPHVSAKSKAASTFLHAETVEKITSGYATVVKWRDIKDNIPAKLKISPVAMVPHKSKQFRCIMDLSFGLKVGKETYKSVNATTNPKSKEQAMLQLGKSLRRIITTMAHNRRKDAPFYFTKLDIKDGFWRLAVSNEDAWNFAYVLPPKDNREVDMDDIQLVIPNSLQMGWCESPPFFCTASETGRDVIERLLREEISLPEHLFESRMFDPTIQYHDVPRNKDDTVTLIEVYVDDYIAMTNDLSITNLTTISRAMLHGIHSIFPPPAVTKHNGGDPIAEKKIAKGEGLWQPQKEILGWIFDGEEYTIQLPESKVKKIVALIKQVLHSKATPLKRFQELAGKIQHASFGIPGGRGLFSPIYAAMIGDPHFVYINAGLRRALEDWRTIIKHFQRHPTPIQLLLPGDPHMIEYTDACKIGSGGVVVSGSVQMPNLVWQVEWPDDIKLEMSNGTITINDLELAGMVLGWLVLDDVVPDLSYKHVGIFCDNTSAVAWLVKGSTTTSAKAAALLRFLHLRIRERKASSFTPEYIPGEHNTMADVSSRAFKDGQYFKAHANLTHYFNLNFPQSKSWQEYHHHPAWISRVISCLRGIPLPMGSLARLPPTGQSTGPIGQIIAKACASAQTSQTAPKSKQSLPPRLSAQGSGQVALATDIRSKFLPSQRRYHPSPRPLSWLEQKVHYTKRRTNT